MCFYATRRVDKGISVCSFCFFFLHILYKTKLNSVELQHRQSVTYFFLHMFMKWYINETTAFFIYRCHSNRIKFVIIMSLFFYFSPFLGTIRQVSTITVRCRQALLCFPFQKFSKKCL